MTLSSITQHTIGDQNTKYPADNALSLRVNAAQPATVERRAAGQHAPSFEELRQRLHRGGQWAYYWTPDTGDFYTTESGSQAEAGHSHWFPAQSTARWPQRWAGNIFFSVHPSKEQRHKKQRTRIQDVAAINCLFAEIDGKDMVQPSAAELATALASIEAEDRTRLAAGTITRMTPPSVMERKARLLAKEQVFKANIAHYNALAYKHVMHMTPAPSVIIHSGGGYHLYWLLAETFLLATAEDRERAKQLQRAWVTFVGGDDGAKDLTRVLRPFGTHNKKSKYAPNYPTVTAQRLDLSIEYDLAELEALLPPAPNKARRQAHGTPQTRQAATVGTPPPTAPTTAPAGYQTIWGAFNAAHTVTELLERYGYTRHGDRYMRPGGDSAPSVEFDTARNIAWTYSSNDPIFNEDYNQNSPFDIFKIWEHDGDFNRAKVAAAKLLGMELALPELAMKAVQLVKDWLISADLAPYVADEHKALLEVLPDGTERRRYSGGHTDKLIANLVLDGMQRAGFAWNYHTSYRRIATTKNSDGVPVMSKSTGTVGKSLGRLAFMFDVVQDGGRTTLTLRRDFVATVVKDRVIRSNTDKDPPDLLEVFDLITRGDDEITTGALVDLYKADDAYQTHTSPAVRKQTRRILRDHDQSGHRIEGVTMAALLAVIPSGLSIFAIPLIAALLAAGGTGCTYVDLVAATGGTKSRVAAIVRILRYFGLVESHTAPFTPSIHFIVPNAFALIHDDVTPRLRTYGAGVTRLDRDLERQAAGNERRAANKDLSDDERKQAERRAARAKHRRMETFAHLHPEWSKAEVTDYVYAATPPRIERTPRAPQMPAPGELAWFRLTTLTGKERLTADEYGEMQTLDRVLNAGVAGRNGEVVFDRPSRY